MDRSTRVYVRICGKGLAIVSDERAEYMKEVAREVDERMSSLIRSSNRVTFDTAAVLNLCDELRQQKLLNRMTVDKNEVEALQKKLTAAEDSIAELKKQSAKEIEEYKKSLEKLRLDWAVREKEYLDMIDEL